MSHLLPCPACHRHVRATEQACPFCSAALDLAQSPAPGLPKSRLGRAATFAFGASIVGATAVAACSADSTGGATDAAAGAAGDSQHEGTGGTSETTGGAAGSDGTVRDGGGVVALYGAAAFDAGGQGPIYGAAPP